MRNTQTNPMRFAQPGRPLRMVMLLTGLLGLAGVAARADEPDPAVQSYAHRLAVGVCGTCHGVQGNSTQPKFPRLAGQNPNYLVAQLKNFRGQTRGDPDAISYMWGMAGPLADDTIDALSHYYASQRVTADKVADSMEIAHGRDIYEHGVPSEGVPACAVCHGPDAHGLADFPRLAGQHSQYILKQLGSFQSNMRNVAVMHGVAQSLRVPEMRAVAAYVESLP